MEKILEKPKAHKVLLDDGQEYELAPVNLYTLEQLEDAFDCNVDQLSTKLNTRLAKTLNKFLYVFLKDNYPDLTEKTIGQKVTSLRKVRELSTLLMDILNDFAG